METEASLAFSQLNSVLILTSYFPKIHYNIIILPMPRSLKWSLTFRFRAQNLVRISCLIHARNYLVLLHLIILTNRLKEKFYEAPCHSFSPSSCYFLSISFKHSLSTLFSDTSNSYSSFMMRGKK